MTTATARRPSRFGEGIDPDADAPAPEPEARPSRPIKVRIPGSLDGCRLEVEADLDVRQLRPLLAALKQRGFLPEAPPIRWDTTADGAPICPKHRVPMRAREKQGDTWHSHKVLTADGQELYCRGHAGPESPGYAVDPA